MVSEFVYILQHKQIPKQNIMKNLSKLLTVFAFATSMYACNNATETKEAPKADSNVLKAAAPTTDTACVTLYTFEDFDLAQLQELMKEKDLTGIRVTHTLIKDTDKHAVVITARYKTTPEKPLVLEAKNRCPLVCN
jgi:hypothetical protein